MPSTSIAGGAAWEAPVLRRGITRYVDGLEEESIPQRRRDAEDL
jgi:hypothetical protein